MDCRLIVALDYANAQDALALVEQLTPAQCALKVGLELFTQAGPLFVRKLVDKGFKVFLDLKFHDIPNTVAQACKACAELGVWMINVHAAGGLAMMQAARAAVEPFGSKKPLLIAVTLLTSLSESDLPSLGFQSSLVEQVERFARLSLDAGLGGVVCSPLEVPHIKKACGQSFLTVTPGIRFLQDDKNDQSRVVTPEKAFELGSDYVVMGRSITRAASPVRAIELFHHGQ
ncbi:MAG: orotidine-5'-phosphate decarboxylase [Tatlockia sp.]|jgi:orotidine-5'-phosphate decarboxylase